MYDIDSEIDSDNGLEAVVRVWAPVDPAVAFAAVATGEGISSWFVPCAMEPHVGGRVIQFADPGAPDPTSSPEAAVEASLTATVGEVTVYDPAGGVFAYVEQNWMGDDAPTPDWTTEFRVESDSRDSEPGSVVTLRSGFGVGGSLVEQVVEGSLTGWTDAMHVLAHRLTHVPDAGVIGVHAATDPRPGMLAGTWARVRRDLLKSDAPEGAGDSAVGVVARVGEVGGIVIAESEASLTLVLSSPHDGICQIYAFPAGESPEDASEQVALAVRVHEYVEGPGGPVGAAAVDGEPTRDTPWWREWLGTLARTD